MKQLIYYNNKSNLFFIIHDRHVEFEDKDMILFDGEAEYIIKEISSLKYIIYIGDL